MMDSKYTFPRTPQRKPAQEQVTSASPTPASRYNYSNLKSSPKVGSVYYFNIQRIYHHDGQQWSKPGYEGSMFLFER
jgi:hypothetical protein